MSFNKKMDDSHNEPEWNSEFEDDEDRMDFYRKVCHGDDEYDEEQLKSWANDRFKHRQTCRATAVYLPSLSSTTHSVDQNTEQSSKDEVKLNLPKGGWQVQRPKIEPENNNLPTLMSSIEIKPKKKFSGPRENAWKKMPNFFSDVAEATNGDFATPVSSPKAEDAPTLDPAPKTDKNEEEYTPAPSRSRERVERSERKPRLLTATQKKDDKPQFLKNTKMCKNGEQCGRRGACTFAHTISEFNPITCRFQERCNQKDTCSFKHSFESKEDYLKRLSNM